MDEDAAPLEPFPGDWERALCVAAHPDDLEYGAASAVAAWTAAGKDVAYVLVTSGEAGIDGLAPEECGPLRRSEEIAGAAAVGVETVEFLEHSDGIVEYGLPLRRDLARAVRRHRPEVVVTLSFDLTWPFGPIPVLNMADHRNVGIAVLDACRDAGNRWIFPELIDEGHEPWSGVRLVAVAASSRVSHGVDVTASLDRGIASLEAHAAYLRGLGDAGPRPAEFLREQAEQLAPRFDGRLVTPFELIAI
jgi:LmbE family N-acetylglucosaminyl deacetylase